jgi:serine acetyltransferase
VFVGSGAGVEDGCATGALVRVAGASVVVPPVPEQAFKAMDKARTRPKILKRRLLFFMRLIISLCKSGQSW